MASLLTFVSLSRESDWLQLLLDVSLKGILVLLVTAAMAVALRRASAAARHLVWSAAVAGLLVLPVLELTLPNWRVPIFPSVTTKVSADEDRIASGGYQSDAAEHSVRPLSDHGATSLSAGTLEPSTDQTTTPQDGSNAVHDYLSLETPVFGEPRGQAALASAPLSEAPSNWGLALLLIWMAGASAVLIRLALATVRVWWIARRAEPMTEDGWSRLANTLAKQLRLKKEPTLLRTDEVSMPVAWGVFRPVVLLPSDADEWSEDWRRIVLLHELSHIKRSDCLTQTLAQVACALHWFNPLAWSAARRLRVEREIACDDQVIEAGTRATDYASYLVEIASSFEPVRFAPPMVAGMACSQLESRVRSILNPGIRRKGLNRLRVGLTSFAAICLVVPLSVVRPWSSASASSRIDDSATSASNAIDLNATDASDASERIEFQSSETAASQFRAVAGEQSSEVPSNGLKADGAVEGGRSSNEVREGAEIQQEGSGKGTGVGQGTGQSAGDGLGRGEGAGQGTGQASGKGEGRSSDLTADQIVRMKMYNITPEFLESVKKLGFDNPSLNQVIQLRIHAVDEAFINQVRGWGYDKLSIDQLVHIKVAGVNTEYVAAMKKAGFENLSVNKLASMKLLGVTPEYVDAMRRSGYDKLTAEQLLSLKTQGVTESFIREAQSWGFGKLSIEELRQLKIFNISPAYAAEMRGLGFQDLPLTKLIQTKIHGVDAGFVQEMRGLGFNDLTIDDLIRMRIHGITPDYVRKMRAAGFKNVSLNKMIEMKISGVDEILLRNSR